MTIKITSILAVIGIVAVVGMMGLTVAAADGTSSNVTLSDDMMTDQGGGICDDTQQMIKQQDMTKEQLKDGTCEQKLAGEGNVAKNQYLWSNQYQHANQNGTCDDVETLEGDQVQNQHEYAWQHDWCHQYGDDGTAE